MLIVDDSIVARAVLRRILEGSGCDVIEAGDARAALDLLARERVNVILLDIEMPGQNGLAALPDILRAGQGARVLIVSSTSAPGAEASVRALALGAADTLVKPGAGVLAGRFAQLLAERVERLTEDHRPGAPAERAAPSLGTRRDAPRIVAIGASTGGIHSLGRLLGELGAACTAPILITQHLPASFMPYFAAQVAKLAGRPCLVAEDRMRLRGGQVYVAPGDGHLVCGPMTDGHVLRLDREKSASGCMPSVDPMFASVAACFGADAFAVMLSGMGRDGAAGAERIVKAGGTLVAQDQESSVVWGMPGAVVAAGLAQAVLPPEAIGRAIAHRFEGGR
ncbi:chemotaxis response regulator protein-glutamate methylesterase [Sphingomonas spermidinifaciens]|uniref:protein-glutamate methylesterase n=1 Tax=Sphingomonas spermidinifaciens TaxID=1141889 RepID=A0A2A4B9S9_9SPHN|nr:chemotaxis response regulator protein-glutamate methylesterase [Sphingomonas spermidinifaciens]